MTRTKQIILSLLAVLCLGSFVSAQTILNNTTLSASVPNTVSSASTSGSMTTVSVTSATGISAPAANTGLNLATATSGGQSYLYVDRELMDVRGVSGTTITVVRGAAGTAAASHANGAVVFVVPAAYIWGATGGAGFAQLPQGSCTRTSEIYLPRIQFNTGIISDCLGGQWVQGDSMQTTRTSGAAIYAPNPGGTIYTSLNSTGTVLAATTMYCTEIQLPYSKYATGLKFLLGTVGATDKHISVLYDSSGNLLANSATAGTTAGTASTYEALPFTAPYYMVGPAQYFGCVQTNGTTATMRMLVTSTQDSFLTKGVTGQTFGTIPATITVPTTFTTAVGPYEEVY